MLPSFICVFRSSGCSFLILLSLGWNCHVVSCNGAVCFQSHLTSASVVQISSIINGAILFTCIGHVMQLVRHLSVNMSSADLENWYVATLGTTKLDIISQRIVESNKRMY